MAADSEAKGNAVTILSDAGAEPPVTDLIEYLEVSASKLLALDSASGEGRAMRDAASRIRALLALLSDEQDAAVAARSESEAMRQLANDHAGVAASRWQEMLEMRSMLLKLVMPLHEAVKRADAAEGQSERDNAGAWQMVEVKDLRAIVSYVRALLGGPRI